jgi:hypothetical protein
MVSFLQEQWYWHKKCNKSSTDVISCLQTISREWHKIWHYVLKIIFFFTCLTSVTRQTDVSHVQCSSEVWNGKKQESFPYKLSSNKQWEMAIQKKHNGISYPKIRLTVSQSVQKQGSYLHVRNSPRYHCVHTPGQWRTGGGGVGVFKSTPPKFRRPSKIIPNSTWFVKTVKNCWI